jgi:hypothetical protein
LVRAALHAKPPLDRQRGWKVVKDALRAPLCGRFFFEKSILDNLPAPQKLEQARGDAELSPKRFQSQCDP